MGRGRAKAKQTKVARDLKYRTHETDFGALARELHGDNDGDTDRDVNRDVGRGTDLDQSEPDEELEGWSDYAQPRRD